MLTSSIASNLNLISTLAVLAFVSKLHISIVIILVNMMVRY